MSEPKHNQTAQDMFDAFFTRLTQATSIRNQQDLAAALGVNRSAITQAKKRNSIPQKWFLMLARKFTLSADWLEFGTGAKNAYNTHVTVPSKPEPKKGFQAVVYDREALHSVNNRLNPLNTIAQTNNKASSAETFFVPKVHAQLSAGGGSLAVEKTVNGYMPFPEQWLASKGSPAAMVLMTVIGQSMEPTFYNQDILLIDCSQKNLKNGSIFAVAHGESILVKRVSFSKNTVILSSDNTAYSPIILQGDELNSFIVIGQILWQCREIK